MTVTGRVARSALRYVSLAICSAARYILTVETAVDVIQSWKTGAAEAIFQGRNPGKGFPADLIKTTRRRLAQLNDATALEDLRVPPSNNLHSLDKDRAGQWAIRVNDQFRICFKWGEKGPEDVEFTDYH